MTAKYHSQVGQDKFINEKVFRGLRNGYFVEIGAFDGVTFSNSYFFEKELGWKGICIEPMKKYYENIVRYQDMQSLQPRRGRHEQDGVLPAGGRRSHVQRPARHDAA